jgi:hypothetical protein
MRRAAAVRGGLAFSIFAAISWTSLAQAVVPTGYTGTPYKGTPQAIPGRVNLADMDEGGLDVAFFADHRRENAVAENYSPLSGDDYRPGNLNLPNICKTNRKLEADEGSLDFWEDGTVYPSQASPFEYYMGYAHTVDWVRMTVDVKVAGTYNISSNWACDSDPECGYSIWFNDGTTTKTDNAQKPMDGENKTGTVKFPSTGDYHKWRAYPNQAKVTLAAGVQIMTFHVEVNNHLQYGFVQFDLEGGNPQGGMGGTGGTAAGGTTAGGTTNGGTPATGGTGATTGGAAPTTGGTGTTTTGGAPVTGTGGAATAGTTSGPVGTSGAPSGTSGSGATNAGNATDEGGCSFAPVGTRSTSAAAALAAALALLITRRRRG